MGRSKDPSLPTTRSLFELEDLTDFSLNMPVGYDPKFHKPTDLIYIHNNLDEYPRRLWNVLLWKSRSALLDGKREFRFEMNELITILSGGKKGTVDANYEQIREGMEKLRVAPIVMLKRNVQNEFVDEMTRCGFISGFTWHRGEGLSWRYDEKLLKYLLSKDNLPLLDVGVVTGLRNKASHALYEICGQIASIPDPTLQMFDIPTAVRLLSGDAECYVKEPRYFKSKCLTPALSDVNEHSEFVIEQTEQRNKFGTLVAIGWKVTLKDEMPEALRAPVAASEEDKEIMRQSGVYSKLVFEYGFTDSFAVQILTKYPYEQQPKRYDDAFKRVEDYKSYCVRANMQIKNLGAFTYRAIESGLAHEPTVMFDPIAVKTRALEQSTAEVLRTQQAAVVGSEKSIKKDDIIKAAIRGMAKDELQRLIEQFRASPEGKIKAKGSVENSRFFRNFVAQVHPELLQDAA